MAILLRVNNSGKSNLIKTIEKSCGRNIKKEDCVYLIPYTKPLSGK
ncbi:MAG: hypothetical protein MJY64_01830 [archaeon]|nr:hypothetical protein [archaeon]